MDLHRWFMNFCNWIMGLHNYDNWIYGDRIMELHIIRFMKIHNAQFHSWSSTICCYMELQTICGDPSSTWWSSIIYILWSSMIEMSTEFHNKLGSSIIMIFVFSGTLCDYGKVKRTRAYRLLNHVVFNCKKLSSVISILKKVCWKLLLVVISWNAVRFAVP